MFDTLKDWALERLSDPGFQRQAAGNLLTRGIARKRARAAFDLCAGFVYSQVLYAYVKLDLLSFLREGHRSHDEIAAYAHLPPAGAELLVKAGLALDLVSRRRHGRFALGQAGAALHANPGAVAMIEHHDMFYADLERPVALLRGELEDTRLKRYWAYAQTHAETALAHDGVNAYSRLMAASQQLIAEDVLDAYDMQRHRKLLDVGGGHGAFLIAVAQRHRDLALELFDLPAVVESARSEIEHAGLCHRIALTGGSFRSDSLPTGADVITLVRILHDHNDDTVAALLESVRKTLPKGGVLLIAEPMADSKNPEPMSDAYFGFYLLAMGQGRPRNPEEISRLLRAAGFRKTRLIPTRRPLLVRLVAGWA